MELERKTKAELIEMLNEQKHLAEAVEAKNNEIVALTMRIQEKNSAIKELQIKINEQKHLAEAIEAKDNEIAKLKNATVVEVEKEKQTTSAVAGKVTALQEEINKLHSDIEVYKKALSENKDLQDRYNKVIYLLEQYVSAYRSNLQGLKGLVDGAITIDALLTEKIK